ncbi:restriction endonuclease subunit S, partial [Treponema denticola]
MNTNALRQKILDLAIHGKLVKQDPADESATILLEKIRAEKEKKIASGELKRGKNDSYIFFGDDNRHYEKFADGRVKDIEDEIPFAVPEGWAWCKLGEIGVLERGITFPSSAKELSPEKNNIPCLRTANVQNNLDFSNLIYVNKVYLRNNHNKLLKKNDIILSSANSRELVGKTAFVYDIIDEMTFGGFVVVIRSFINNYLFYFLRREFFSGKFMEKSTQTTNIANIKTDTLANYFVPLPPLSEQKRIVTAIEAILAQIDLLEQNKVDLQTAVKQAKSKILDLAIR